MIEKGGIIRLTEMKKLELGNLLSIMLFSTGVRYASKIITIHEAMERLLKTNPNEKIGELWEDYQKGQLWQPQKERHSLFPTGLKTRIYYFVLSIKSKNKQLKLPKPLQYMIINLFIKN